MRRIHVMAAVIRRADGCILIAKRPDHAHQGGLWEFPGGKLETDEPRFDGLARELLEELGIQITEAHPLIDIRHDYPDKSIRLDVWSVSGFTGEAHGAEGQQVHWVAPQDLGHYKFPAANRPIVLAATLPQRYLITPDDADIEKLFAGLETAGGLGIRLVQLRRTGLSQSDYNLLAEHLTEHLGDTFAWMLKGEQPPHSNAGWHLTSRQLRSLHEAGWSKGQPFAARPPLPQDGEPLQPGWERSPDREGVEPAWNGLLAASCHDEEELHMANEIGADFATLSPVLPTQSHPGSPHLGWERTAELLALANMPVYLLGGLSSNDLERAQKIGAQGIAAISGLWPSEGPGEGPR